MPNFYERWACLLTYIHINILSTALLICLFRWNGRKFKYLKLQYCCSRYFLKSKEIPRNWVTTVLALHVVSLTYPSGVEGIISLLMWAWKTQLSSLQVVLLSFSRLSVLVSEYNRVAVYFPPTVVRPCTVITSYCLPTDFKVFKIEIDPKQAEKPLYHTTGWVISLVTDFTQTLKPLIDAS